MKNNEENKRRSGADLLALLLHSVIGITLSLLLSLIAVFFVQSATISPEATGTLSSVFILTGASVSGFLSAKKFGKPLIIALAQSVLFLSVLYLTGALLYGRAVPAHSPVTTISFCVVGALLGSVMTVLRFKKKGKHSH